MEGVFLLIGFSMLPIILLPTIIAFHEKHIYKQYVFFVNVASFLLASLSGKMLGVAPCMVVYLLTMRWALNSPEEEHNNETV